MLAFGFLWLVTRKATPACRRRRRRSSSCASTSSTTRSRASSTATARSSRRSRSRRSCWCCCMNAMDFLPVDIMALDLRARVPSATLAQRAHRRRQHDVRAGAVGVRADDLLQHQGQGPRRLDPRALLARRSAEADLRRCCWSSSTCCSSSSSTCRSRCRTRCGCSATCTRARSSSCCSACGPRPASSARRSAACCSLGWAIFHILIVAAAGLHLHDADHRLHRDGARAPLIRLRFVIRSTSTVKRKGKERHGQAATAGP